MKIEQESCINCTCGAVSSNVCTCAIPNFCVLPYWLTIIMNAFVICRAWLAIAQWRLWFRNTTKANPASTAQRSVLAFDHTAGGQCPLYYQLLPYALFPTLSRKGFVGILKQALADNLLTMLANIVCLTWPNKTDAFLSLLLPWDFSHWLWTL